MRIRRRRAVVGLSALAVAIAALLGLLGAALASETRVACAGEGDAERIQNALDAAIPGERILLGGGEACVLERPLTVPDGVHLAGAPSAEVRPGGPAVEGARIECTGAAVLENLHFVIDRPSAAAIYCTSDGSGAVRLRSITVAASVAPSRPLIEIKCSPSTPTCVSLEEIRIVCDGRAVGQATAIEVGGADLPTKTRSHRPRDREVRASGIAVDDCRIGIAARGTKLLVRDSALRVSGKSSRGIQASDRLVASNVLVRVTSGEGAIGIRAGEDSSLRDNRITILASKGTGIRTLPRSTLSGNSIDLQSVVQAVALDLGREARATGNSIRGTDDRGSIGAILRQGLHAFTSNLSTLGAGGNSTHVEVRGVQNLINSNTFTRGDWGVRPAIFEGGNQRGFVNGARLVGNNFIFNEKACAVLQTGWHAQSNSCSWVGGEDGVGFWIGSPGPYGMCTQHTLISGNMIHTGGEASSAVRFTTAGSRCHRRDEDNRATWRSCDRESPCGPKEICLPPVCANIGIFSNQLLGRSTTPIDVFSAQPDTGERSSVDGLDVVGNSVHLPRARALVHFPGDKPGEVRGVTIADNGIGPPAPAANWHSSFARAPTEVRRPPRATGEVRRPTRAMDPARPSPSDETQKPAGGDSSP